MSAPANAMSLLDLPPDMLGGVVFGWLHTKSIVRLDSSVCCNKHRSTFLAFLRSEHAILRELPATELSKAGKINALQWATVRKVRCKTLRIPSDVDSNIVEKYLCFVHSPDNVYQPNRKETKCLSLMIAAHCRTMRTFYCLRSTLCSSVRSVCACCVLLQDIFLYECNVAAAHFAGTTCPNVRTLVLMGCQCGNQCMFAAVAMCPNIVNLDIGRNNVSDEAVRDTVTKLPKLQKLSLYALPVSDETVADVSVACCSLTAIDLGDCAALTDVAVIALATNCKQLTHIQLFSNTNYTRESLRAIALHCAGLKRCVFGKFHDAKQEDEVLLFNSCRQLERVEMPLSSPISLGSIPPTLTQLTLQAETTTDAMLIAVAKHCKNLTKFFIAAGTPAIRLYTAKGLAALAKGCTKLQKLVLQGNAEQVNELTLLVWRNICPRLQVVGSHDWWEYYIFSPVDVL